MNASLARVLVNFANSHDDGTDQPRAEYCPTANAVLVRSTEVNLDTGVSQVATDKVTTLGELRNLLGY